MKLTNVMEEVKDFLNSLSLGEYIRPTCDRNVYDYLVCTLAHDDDDLDILVSYVDILSGHSFHLKQVVTDIYE